MIFSSITFLFCFLPVFLICYRLLPMRFKNIFLVFSSLFFYAWGEPKYVLLMLFSTVADYTLGILIGNSFAKNEQNRARFFMICSVLINLSLLIFFKYSNFFLESVQNLTGFDFALAQIALPIGISFYTFQTMSYSIDVYRKKVAPQRNFTDFAVYVTLFPQLIAGPIVRYQTVEKELKKRIPDYDSGVELFIIGLAQKVLLANNMGLLWEEISTHNLAELASFTAWLGIIAYAFQIYFDFCGYSNMAIGLGRMLGFHFPQNFNKPYISKSITEFWQRWHISLSTWFKEYVYIPLGGNRRGLVIQIRNILIVWLLTGIWHGANWNFLFWGLYFGFLLIIEKIWLGKKLAKMPAFFQHLYAVFCILMGWVLFAFDNVSGILAFLSSLFGANGLADSACSFYLYNYMVLFLLSALCSTPLPEKLFHFLKARWKWTGFLKQAFLIIIFLLSIAYIVDSSYNPFLYFRF